MLRFGVLVLVFGVSLLTGGPGKALSCAESSVLSSFHGADESDLKGIIALGRLVGKSQVSRPNDGSDEKQFLYWTDEEFTSEFHGYQLGTNGFTKRLDAPVLVQERCIHEWCGSVSLNRQSIFFLIKTEEGLVLSISACDGVQFTDPTRDQINQLKSCVRGQNCPKPQY